MMHQIVLVIFFATIANSVYTGNHEPSLQYQFNRSPELNRFLFQQFIEEHNKSYADEQEHEERFMIFEKNLAKIDLLNRLEQGTAKYGLTRFADMTRKEFKQSLGLRPELKDPNTPKPLDLSVLNDTPLPESFDWRDHGAVTEVKDQGFCGSCWAFSTTGNVEGINFLKHGELISLSEQELVDCDKLDNGCGGGYMTNAYKSIMDMGGLETEKDYPYEGYLSEGCAYNKSKAKVDIDSFVTLPTNETQLAQWLVQNGPISVGINAAVMQFYKWGVSHPAKWLCRSSKIDHGVLLVGYGITQTRWTKKPLPYWIIKNSWGSSYGRKGYYYMYRGDGSCGINTMATSAVINN